MNATDEAFERAVEVAEENNNSTPREVADKLGYKRKQTLRRYLTEAGERELWDRLKANKEQNETPTKNKVEVEREGNKAEVTSRTDRIKTLEQLIDEANINLDKWEIKRHVINKWDGQMEGGDPVPLWQVKAWLEKKTLTEKEFEPVQPVDLDFSYKQPDKPTSHDLRKAVIIPDTHIGYRRDSYTNEMIPFHDRRCLDLDLQLINDIEPNKVIILGDYLDMPSWQDKFVKSDEFSNITQAAIEEGHWWLRNIRETVPDSKIHYIQGNHEQRVIRFVKKNKGAAYGIKPATATKDDPDLNSVQRMLDLPSLQVNWTGNYPDGGVWVNDNLVSEHGETTSSVSGKTAGKVLDDARESHIFGHVHRVESATKTTYPKNGPKIYQATSLGCQVYLGESGTETPGRRKKQDWQNAVGVVEYEPGNSRFYVKPIFINDGEMIYNGKHYKGKNRLDSLKAQTNLTRYNFVDN